MSEDIVNNNPKKELLYALGGVGLFLAIVLLIGVSAFLRPAGEHITADTTESSAAANEAETVAAEDAAPAEADAVTAEEGTALAAADAATASGTVSQVAVADADLTAEQADGDLDAGNAADDTAAAQ
ncbi:hypothetical protein [Psychrobacter sp. W2-37-MNA-CIBAN-0211]|uniref:hypothetical protein n=1 Tax=Psychrobacter sp. W2-37-MNA-CIBAN-0211 TaxID=3140443 RepID=UPI0033251B07